MKKLTMSGKLVFLFAAAALLVTGCIKQKILIKVKPDGSGSILVSAMYSKKMVDMFDKQMEKQRARMEAQGMDSSAIDKGMQDPFFNEKELKKQAAKFGEGVEYSKAKKVKNASGRGFMALYTFKNIEDVKIDLKKMTNMMPQFGNQKPSDDDSVSFKLKKGKVAELTVNIPKQETPEVEEGSAEEEVSTEPTPLTDQDKAQMMANGNMFGLSGKEKTKEEVIRKMLGDMAISVQVQVDGTVIKSNATHKDPKKKGRFTLFSVDYGVLLEDDKVCSKMAKSEGGSNPMESLFAKENIKGIEIEKKPTVIVEFKK